MGRSGDGLDGDMGQGKVGNGHLAFWLDLGLLIKGREGRAGLVHEGWSVCTGNEHSVGVVTSME